MSWQQINLGGYIHIKHGYAFKSQYFADDGEKVLLTPGNFFEKGGFRRRRDKDRYFVGEYPESFELSENDLIVAMTEQGPGLLGSSAWIPSEETYLHNQRLGLVTITKETDLDKRFLYYLFNTREIRAQINASATGTKVRHTAPERIYKVKTNIPDKPTQKKIARTLTAYDDLIENNKRRIELLEESARQLYKEWFVRFRFPGHEHVKIIDGVPEGWERTTYGEIAETVGGGTPSTKVSEYWEDGDVTWFVPKDLTNNNSLVLLDSEKKITKLGLQKSSAKMLPPNTIMMSSRASIGYFGLYDGEASTNQGFISVIPKQKNTHMYLLHNLMSRKEEIIGLAGGTTYKEINKTTFRSIELLIPPDTLLDEFQEFASDLISQVRLLMKQTKQLTNARDLLLPKLMSGEIAV